MIILEKDNHIFYFIISSDSPKNAMCEAYEKLVRDSNSKKDFEKEIKGKIGKPIIKKFEILSGYKILFFSILPKIIFYNSEKQG